MTKSNKLPDAPAPEEKDDDSEGENPEQRAQNGEHERVPTRRLDVSTEFLPKSIFHQGLS